MTPADRVRAIKGPQSTTICYLLQAGWDPKEPTCWTTPDDGTGTENSWQFDVENLTGFSDLDVPPTLFDEFGASVQSSLWAQAAVHFEGAGMERGVCNFSYRRLLRHLEQAPEGRRLAGMLLSVAVGAAWPRTRRQTRTKQIISEICVRCRQVKETALHRVWGCEGCDRGHPIYKMTEHLVSKALVQGEAEACFWTRGLIPAQWLAVDAPLSNPD